MLVQGVSATTENALPHLELQHAAPYLSSGTTLPPSQLTKTTTDPSYAPLASKSFSYLDHNANVEALLRKDCLRSVTINSYFATYHAADLKSFMRRGVNSTVPTAEADFQCFSFARLVDSVKNDRKQKTFEKIRTAS